MIETRCKNSGALLFRPSGSEQETINIKKENKKLKDRLDKLEKLVLAMKDNNHV